MYTLCQMGERGDYSGIRSSYLAYQLNHIDDYCEGLSWPMKTSDLLKTSVPSSMGLNKRDYADLLVATKEVGIITPLLWEEMYRRSAVRGYDMDRVRGLVVVNSSLQEVVRGTHRGINFYRPTPWRSVYEQAMESLGDNYLRSVINEPIGLDDKGNGRLEVTRRKQVHRKKPSIIEPTEEITLSIDNERDLREYLPKFTERQLETLREWNKERMGDLVKDIYFSSSNHDVIPVDGLVPKEVQLILKLYLARVSNLLLRVGDELTFTDAGRTMGNLITAMELRPNLKSLADLYSVIEANSRKA